MATGSPSIASISSLSRLTELKQRIWFLLGALLVYRIGTFIPVPGVNPEAMVRMMEQHSGTIIDMFNMFSGGALGRFSVFALSVMPYISASIIVQLLSYVHEPWIALRKEGESGRRKLNQYTRWGTLALAIVQGGSISIGLQSMAPVQGVALVPAPGWAFVFVATIALTAGTMFLMWLGEQITERGIGNGISMIIFAGIVAGLPGAIGMTGEMAMNGELAPLTVIFIAALALAVTGFVVFVEQGQRRITVNYARRMAGRQAYMNQSSHLPLKLNMSGVIPAIFASSLIMFPATVASWMGQEASGRVVQRLAAALSPGEPLYMILYGALIFGFAFFYTALVFNSQETADNLKKSGALIPGIRPGKATADYIDAVLTRLTTAGALYLVAVCLLPEVLHRYYAVPFYFGGTSLLIIVVVAMDFMAQVRAHSISHQYDSVLKKANLKGIGRPGTVKQ